MKCVRWSDELITRFIKEDVGYWQLVSDVMKKIDEGKKQKID